MHFSAGIIPKLIILISTIPIFCHCVKELAEILQLRAEPDFRVIKLHWEYPKTGANFHGFQIHYCELQAWGPNRCRTKIVDESTGIESVTGKKFRMYSVIISSLRMATNYSFEVRPLEVRQNSQYMKNYGKSIVVPTKGFSAKASLCLPDISEVEVSTGPYFGGRIAVESSDGSKIDNCSVDGDINSAKDTYVLRIEHKTCGSTVNRTTVSTFILVQETLPILTHSTRRFVVLCTFQPETLTVRAGINLPYSGFVSNPSATSAVPLRNEISLTNEILGNDVQPASLMQISEGVNYARNFKSENEVSHYFLVSVLLMTSIIGIVLTVWWTVPLKKSVSLNNKTSTLSIFSNNSGTSTAYENYTSSVKDNSSITEIDFGEIFEEKYFSENCYTSEAFNPVIKKLQVSHECSQNNPIFDLSTQSEA